LALDTSTFYVVPRVNPDGADAGLRDGRWRRSSVRPYPFDLPRDGLHRDDLDGDGRVLFMRLRDPNGSWKPHPEEPRLLVARRPDDVAGDFYRVFPEGTIRNWDGVTVPMAPALEGLDLNRNWPADWAPESEQRGAGPYPTSEPEVRALVQAIVDRPNVTSYVGYHTFSGVHLRPYSARADEEFPTSDLRAFKLIGEEATRITGYPAISIFHDFKYDPKLVIRGGDVDWVYDFLGAIAWVTEFWSPQRAAGLGDYHFIDWLRDHSPEDELALLRLADELGEGYVDWYPFEHPQLGQVELGGWDLVRFWFNPPLARLEEEVTPHADFAVFLALSAPRLEIRLFESAPVGDGAHRLLVVLENAGWLPTNVTQKALDRNAVQPIEVTLELPGGARLATGKEREEVGQLDGRVEHRSVTWWGLDHSTKNRIKLEWVVEAAAGTRVSVVARHQRAGTVRGELVL
ncbi:MAG TPA: M14 family metallopeptidase, partial [Gaiellaceae bacterium]|nr:M14 family metallopeptidase [Gaiellaceae bacterium]